MPRATTKTGKLQIIDDCYVEIADRTIMFRILPEISDSKGASYNDEPIMGRSFPIKTYSHSENRSISMRAHFIVTEDEDIERNMADKRAIESASYPRDLGSPYRPPPICKLKCGKVLGDSELCVILRNYNTSYPTNVAYDSATLLPYYFTMNLTWEVVYNTASLPGQELIMQSGR